MAVFRYGGGVSVYPFVASVRAVAQHEFGRSDEVGPRGDGSNEMRRRPLSPALIFRTPSYAASGGVKPVPSALPLQCIPSVFTTAFPEHPVRQTDELADKCCLLKRDYDPALLALLYIWAFAVCAAPPCGMLRRQVTSAATTREAESSKADGEQCESCRFWYRCRWGKIARAASGRVRRTCCYRINEEAD